MSTYLFSELFPEENRAKITSINNPDYGTFRSMSAPFSQDNNDSHKWLEASVIAGNPYKWQITSCTVLNGDIVSSSPEDYPPLCLVDAISVLSEFEESRRILKLPLIDSNHLFPGQSEIPAHYAKVARDSHITLENGHPSFPNLKKQPPTPKDAQAAKEAFKNALFAYDLLKNSGGEAGSIGQRNGFVELCADKIAPNIDDDETCISLLNLSIEAMSEDAPEIKEGGVKLAKSLIENNPNRLSSFIMAALKAAKANINYHLTAMYLAYDIVNFSKDPELAEEAFSLLQFNNYSNIVDDQHRKLAKIILAVNPALSDRAIKLACDRYAKLPSKSRWLNLGAKALEVNPSLINKFMDLMDEAKNAPITEHPHVLSLINKALDISSSSEIAQRSVACVKGIVDYYQPKNKFTKLEGFDGDFVKGNKADFVSSLPIVKSIIDRAIDISIYNLSLEEQNDAGQELEIIDNKAEKTGLWQSLRAMFRDANNISHDYDFTENSVNIDIKPKPPIALHNRIIADAAHISNELTQWHYGHGAHYLCYVNSKALTTAHEAGLDIFKSLLEKDPSCAQDLLTILDRRNIGDTFVTKNFTLKIKNLKYSISTLRAGGDVTGLFDLHELSNRAKLYSLLINSDASQDVLNKALESANGFKNDVKRNRSTKPLGDAVTFYDIVSKTISSNDAVCRNQMGMGTKQKYSNQVHEFSQATRKLEAEIAAACSNMLDLSYLEEAESLELAEQ